MATRERVHDLGVFKAVGMTPWQTLIMIVCWVVAPTIIAAAIALPAGLTLQDLLIRRLAATATGITALALPGSFVHVLGVADLALLVLAGLGIAAAGALGPATWAAESKTTRSPAHPRIPDASGPLLNGQARANRGHGSKKTAEHRTDVNGRLEQDPIRGLPHANQAVI
jgi:hypothetical protein